MGPERPYDRCLWTEEDFAWLTAVECGEASLQAEYNTAQGAILGWFVCYVAGMVAGFVLAVAIIA